MIRRFAPALVSAWLAAVAGIGVVLPATVHVLVDPDGRPVADAVVSVVGRGGSVPTDGDGRFRLDPPPVAPYRLVVFDATGALIGTVNAADDAERLVLAPAGVETVQVVQGVSPDTLAPPGAAATVLTREERDRARPDRLVDVVEETPGVARTSTGQAAVPAVRGLARGRTLVLIDDARVTTERRAGPSATFLNPLALERVEVVRGPGSVAYGSDALGGILHVRTPRPRPDRFGGRFEVSGAAGLPMTSAAAEVNLPLDGGGFLVQAHAREFDDYRSPEGEVANSSARDRGVLARGRFGVGDGWLDVGVQHDRVRDLERPASDTDRRETRYPEEESDRLSFGVDLPEAAGFRNVHVRAFLGEYRLTTERVTFATASADRRVERSDVEAKDASVRLVGDRPAGRGFVRLGAEWVSRFDLAARDTVAEYPDAGPPVVIADGDSIEDARRQDTSLFGEFERSSASGAVTLAAGLRADAVRTRNRGGAAGDRTTDDESVSGYGAVRWKPGSGETEYSLRVSRGFRDPGLSARYFNGTTGRGAIVGNPALEAETSRQLDLAVISPGRRVRWAAYGFLYRIRDLVERFENDPDPDPDPDVDLFGFRNRGEQELYGAELEAEADLTERLSLRASAAWARGEILDDGMPAADVPATNARLALLHRPSERWWWRVVATGFLRDDRPGDSEVVTPGVVRFDASAGFKLRRDLEVRLLLGNLTDRAYPDGPDRRAPLAPGITSTLTLAGRF